jgi:hypothetical protein
MQPRWETMVDRQADSTLLAGSVRERIAANQSK